MRLTKPTIETSLVLSLDFDETKGTIVVATAHAPPLNLKSALGYGLTPAEARTLSVALSRWADLKS